MLAVDATGPEALFTTDDRGRTPLALLMQNNAFEGLRGMGLPPVVDAGLAPLLAKRETQEAHTL